MKSIWKKIASMSKKERMALAETVYNPYRDTYGYPEKDYFKDKKCDLEHPCTTTAKEGYDAAPPPSEKRHFDNAIRYVRLLEKARQALKINGVSPEIVDEIEFNMCTGDYKMYLNKSIRAGQQKKFDRDSVILTEEEEKEF